MPARRVLEPPTPVLIDLPCGVLVEGLLHEWHLDPRQGWIGSVSYWELSGHPTAYVLVHAARLRQR